MMLTGFKWSRPHLSLALAFLLPVVLWVMLWAGLQSASLKAVINPANPVIFLHGVRGLLPFMAASVAIVIICYKLFRQRPRGFPLVGPLGFTVVYGLIGLVAAFLSPNIWVAIRWVLLYLSVPVVLWAIAWRTPSRESISALVKLNWLLIMTAFAALFIIALIKFDLSSILLSHTSLWKCEPLGSWHSLTSGVLRSTGVGRFAAITAIISFSLLWRPNYWRAIWFLIFYLSVVFMMTTGARTSLLGFFGAVPLIAMLHGGKKAVIIGAIGLAVLAPAAWFAEVPQTFAQTCILREYDVTGIAYLEIRTPETLVNFKKKDSHLNAIDTTGLAPEKGSIADLPTKDLQALIRLELLDRDDSWQKPIRSRAKLSFLPKGFLRLTGRTSIWATGWEFVKLSPFLGYGFHADRLVMGTHMHNAIMHALIQTGIIGTIPFVAALVVGWVLVYKNSRKLNHLPETHKHLVIQTIGILLFLSVRGIPESTGAFYGIDWLLLAPVLFYLQIVSSIDQRIEAPTGG